MTFQALIVACLCASATIANADWKPVVDLEDLFPSYIISTASMELPSGGATPEDYIGDRNGQVGCIVTATEDNQAFTLEISSRNFIDRSVLSGRLKKQGQKYRLYPRLVYDFDALHRVREPVPEAVRFKLTIGDGKTEEKTINVQVRSLQDCVLYFEDTNGNLQDATPMLAAYVNENHPLVDKILREALKLDLVDQFAGYQQGEGHVMQQVFAVWNVLQRHNIQYSSITRPSAYSKNVFSQHVRSFEDAFTNKQANCVDGSVLLASVFRKIGLDAFIVLKPGHCYMGVYSKKDKSVVLILETTAIGSVDVNESSLERGWNSFMSGRDNNLSRTSFERAMDAGWRQYQEDRTKFNKEFGYRLLEIDPARRIGITPLKSKSL